MEARFAAPRPLPKMDQAPFDATWSADFTFGRIFSKVRQALMSEFEGFYRFFHVLKLASCALMEARFGETTISGALSRAMALHGEAV